MNQNNTDELYHHGIKGQRWGFRRYQNKDGSLTPAGRKRADKLKSKYLEVTGKRLTGRAISTKGKTSNQDNQKNIKDIKKKSNDELSEDELKTKISRLKMEKESLDLQRQINSLKEENVSNGKKFVKYVWNNAIKPSATEAGKRVLTDYVTKLGKDYLGLNEEDPLAKLRKEVDTLELQNRRTDALNKREPKPKDPLADLRAKSEKLKLENNINKYKHEIANRNKKNKKK